MLASCKRYLQRVPFHLLLEKPREWKILVQLCVLSPHSYNVSPSHFFYSRLSEWNWNKWMKRVVHSDIKEGSMWRWPKIGGCDVDSSIIICYCSMVREAFSCEGLHWRGGFTCTLEQTSVNRFAVMFLSSLWRIDGTPPLLQFMASSTLNVEPHIYSL